MKKVLMIVLLVAFIYMNASNNLYAQEFKVVTIVESIVPAGVGRSRILEHQEPKNHDNFTTNREEGTDSKQKKVKRKELRIDAFEETKLLNFYSFTGINFRNIASNDAIITSKINEMIQEGWELAFVTSGTESDAGGSDGKGIFITRLFFKK